jgi:hypothetical protein
VGTVNEALRVARGDTIRQQERALGAGAPA